MRPLVALLLLLVASGCERGDEICTDGLDNNGDRAIDCDDELCSSRPDCRGALLFADSVVDRHYWFEDEAVIGPGIRTDGFEWGGDLDGDGLTDVSLSRSRHWTIDPLDSEADVVAVPSSWIEDPELVDLDGPALLLQAAGNDAFLPSSTSLCDVDGDDFDDLVHVDTWLGYHAAHPPSRPLSLSILLGGSSPDWPGAPLVSPLASLLGTLQTVHCAGDLDGDGAGDLVLSSRDEHWLLDGALLAAGHWPEAAVRRHWTSTPNEDLLAAGDLDGDGYDDLFFRRAWGDTCDFDDEWPLGAILPGGPHLVEPKSNELSIYDEDRQAVDAYTEAHEISGCSYLSDVSDDVSFSDLNADSRPDFIRGYFHRDPGIGWPGTAFIDLGQDVHLRRDQLLFRELSRPDQQVGIDAPIADDLDGDGFVDIVATGGGRLVPGSVPWTNEDGEYWGHGLAVFFGAGSSDLIELAWEDADVFVVDRTGIPHPRIVEDRDGDGLLEIGYASLSYHSPETLTELPTAGFIPGSALVDFKRPATP